MRILGYAFSRFFTAFSVQRVLNFKRAAVLRSKMLTQVQHYEIWRFRIDMVFSYRVAFRKTRPGISRVFTVKILSFASSLHSFGTGSSESMVEAARVELASETKFLAGSPSASCDRRQQSRLHRQSPTVQAPKCPREYGAYSRARSDFLTPFIAHQTKKLFGRLLINY